jgi:hypothetical protein
MIGSSVQLCAESHRLWRAALLLLALLLPDWAACGDNVTVPADGGVADQSPNADVATPFAPTARTIAEAAGLAYLPPVGTSVAEEALRRTDLALVSAAGLRTLRHEFLWAEIEPERGRFDFEAHDRVVAAALAVGLDVVPVLAYGAPWAATGSDGDPAFPPDDPADFARFVGETVAHFAGRLHTYEIWNNENVGWCCFKGREDAARYGELLQAAARAGRAADPDVVIVLGGLRYHQEMAAGALGFLEDLFAAHPDIGSSFDVLALHPYATYPSLAAPEDAVPPEVPMPQMVARVRGLLARHGDAKPIFVTGFGWPVYGGVDEARQASYLVRGFVHLAAAGVDLILWRTLRDGPAFASFPPEDAFGLLRYDPDPIDDVRAEPKVAWQALLNLLWMVGDERLLADLREELALDEWSYAYRLGRSGNWITVMWRGRDDEPSGVTVRVPVRGPLHVTALVTLIGAQLPLIEADGSWEIAVGPEPVYLIERVE